MRRMPWDKLVTLVQKTIKNVRNGFLLQENMLDKP
jgi:hypothetical protein